MKKPRTLAQFFSRPCTTIYITSLYEICIDKLRDITISRLLRRDTARNGDTWFFWDARKLMYMYGGPTPGSVPGHSVDALVGILYTKETPETLAGHIHTYQTRPKSLYLPEDFTAIFHGNAPSNRTPNSVGTGRRSQNLSVRSKRSSGMLADSTSRISNSCLDSCSGVYSGALPVAPCWRACRREVFRCRRSRQNHSVLPEGI